MPTQSVPPGWPSGSDWTALLKTEFAKPYFSDLLDFVARQRAQHSVFPNTDQVFRAFGLTRFDETRVVILGQDPYHGPGQAHGLSFSVPPGIAIPPSLRNIFKELASDLGQSAPGNGDLSGWAEQGVLLLNTVLTVRAGQPHSHRNRGWEPFTDRVIQCLGQRNQATVFVLWGKAAGSKKNLINRNRHLVIESPHPSPLSASRGFLGSQPFSKINFFLFENGRSKIDWIAQQKL